MDVRFSRWTAKRYSWLLYSTGSDAQPIDTVVLDVTPAEAILIDSELGIAVRQISKFSNRGQITVLLADDHKVLRQVVRALPEAEHDTDALVNTLDLIVLGLRPNSS